jgi:ABC-type Fe3+ transport system substrate-binding protein
MALACEPRQALSVPPPYVMQTPAPTVRAPTETLDVVSVSVAGDTTPSPSVRPTTDDDWDAITRRALLAGKLLIYSDAARTLTSVTNMLGAYPGLDVAGRVMGGAELCATLADADEAAMPDLVLASGMGCVQRLARDGYLEAYLPASLQASLEDDMVTPVLTHHWEIVGLHHNGLLGEEQSLASWWDLVTPAWEGRVALADPLLEDRALAVLEALVAHDDLLRASYGGQLGADALEGEPAWSVWLDALLANEVLLLPSDAEVARWVGDPTSDGPRAGFCSSVHWKRVLRGELNLEFAVRAAPVAGVRWRTYVAPVASASNPDGARLALAWLLGDDSGRGGYEPWYQVGLYPSRIDVPLPDGSVERSALIGRLWEVPPDLQDAERNALLAAFMGE